MECYERALRAEFRLNQMKKEKTRISETRRNKGRQNSEVAVKSLGEKSDKDSKKKPVIVPESCMTRVRRTMKSLKDNSYKQWKQGSRG